MKHSLKTLCAIAAFTAPAHAQYFYNGYRGPRKMQIDAYASQGTFTAIPKAFLDDALLAAPTVNGKVLGINAGYIIDPKKGIGAIAAAGIFCNEQGKYRKVVSQLYVTAERNTWTIDAEANKADKINAALTVGKQIAPRLRTGASLATDKSWRALAR